MEVPFASVTTTSSEPAAVADVTAVIFVAVTTVTEVAALPIVTVAPETNPVPLIVTFVPPPEVPEAGAMDVTLGGGGAM